MLIPFLKRVRSMIKHSSCRSAMSSLRKLYLGVAFGVLIILSGCASYQLGPTNDLKAGTRSIEIRPFKNESLEPRLVEVIDHSLKRAAQRDGTLFLETQGRGDYVVTGEIKELDRAIISLQPGDTLTARDYRITLQAHVIVKERVTGRELVNDVFVGRTNLRIGSDLSSAERMAAPMAAESLAYNIISAVVDGTF